MFKKIAIVSAIVVMTAMIAAMGVTTTQSTQEAHAARCKGNINVCNIQACAQVGVLTTNKQPNVLGCQE